MIELDIIERLRGKVRVPVNDGAGLLDGKDFFERTFPTSKAAMEAADEIERLRAQNASERRSGMIDAMDLIGNMRQSEAGLFDIKHSGQRGEDRSTALRDAIQVIRTEVIKPL